MSGARKGRRDVGQRPERTQRDGARRLRPQGLDQEVDRVHVLQRHRRIGQGDPVEPGLAMHVFRGDEPAFQRRIAPGKDRMSVRPASSQTIRAFFWVSASGTLPATAVMPSTSTSSGLASARRIATASS
jgi:hypothetical protein